MARPLRVHIPRATYHVMSRGNARQQIFIDPEDYQHFLERLSATTARFRVLCRAYCLMPNHFHLLLEPNQLPLSRMMQQLNSSYSQWFNRRHERVGHVLQGRFKALLVDKDAYFRSVLRYIARNPVEAGAVDHPEAWPWSSYRATVGLIDPVEFLALDAVWRAFDPGDARSAKALFADFVRAPDVAELPRGPVVCGSGDFTAQVGVMLEPHRGDVEIVYAERFAVRPGLDRLFGNARDARSRDASMREAFARHGYTLREIGDFLGLPPSTVWWRIKRVRENPTGSGTLENRDLTPY